MVNAGSSAPCPESLNKVSGRPVQVTPTINILCIVGALIGLAAIFSPWAWYEGGFVQISHNLDEQLVHMVPDALDHWLFIGGAAFCIGVLIAFVTSFGGLVQLFGLVLFFYDSVGWFETLHDWKLDAGLGVGFFVGIASCAIVCLSIVRPLGIGYSKSGIRSTAERFYVMNHNRGSPSSGSAPGRVIGLSFLRLLLLNGEWAAVLLSAILVGAAFVGGMNYSHGKSAPLDEVEGGVAWKIADGQLVRGGTRPFAVTVNDSIHSVSWSMDYSAHNESSSWTAYTLGSRLLGDMNLTLTFVNWDGNGSAGFGDAFFVVASGPDTFAEDRLYRMTYSAMSPFVWPFVWGYTEISFKFHDGELHSWISKDPRGKIYL